MKKRKILFIMEYEALQNFLAFLNSLKNNTTALILKKKLIELEILKKIETDYRLKHNLIISLIFENNSLYGININRNKLQFDSKELSLSEKINHCKNLLDRYKAYKSLVITPETTELLKKNAYNFLFKDKDFENNIVLKTKKI